ncbi:MAG: ribosome-associated translation inhibitor RaiA [Pseudomonadota bacterium]
MQTSVTFKNLDPSDNLKAYICEKLDKLDKFLDNPAEATVVFLIEKFRHIAEVNITGDRLNIYGKEETNDMYSAIDMVIDKLEKQIKKNKQKIRKRRVNHKEKSIAKDQEVIVSEDQNPGQIKIRNIEYKPMDIDEAVMQMDLVTDNFLVFTNAHSDKINVLYRRKDGNYGLIQPIS